MDNKKVRKFTWRIENFSSLDGKKLYSNIFFVGGNKWRILIFPKGNNVDKLSIFLDVADSATLPDKWSIYAQFRLSVINQKDSQNSLSKDTSHEFCKNESDWGFTSFLPLNELHDPCKGYIIKDVCIFEADISTDRTISVLSYKFTVETDSNELKNKEADNGQDETKSTTTTKELPSAQPSSGSEIIEPEYPADEEIDTFFTSLEYDLAKCGVDSSQEEAKKAVAKIEEALNKDPVHFYESGKLSPLKKAFKVISGWDCSSALTIEQKNELLAMEENFKELPVRVMKAVKDKNVFSEKEYVKLTLTSNLEKNLRIFKENKAEQKQVDQRIDALLVKLDEEQKNKRKILNDRKETFKITKNMKMELENLEKELPECEAKAKAGEEEEKTVVEEWRRMKEFISSMKEKF